MSSEEEVLRQVEGIEVAELRRWIDSGLVVPRRRGRVRVFAEVDVARIRLIKEIRDELQVDEDIVPVVLSLLDQVYGLRRELRRITAALQRQPPQVRRQVLEHLGRPEAAPRRR